MFILASASPRRRALLHQIGAQFVPITPAVDEAEGGTHPRDAVIRNALTKARKVAEEYPDHAVLGADTAVVLSDMSFGNGDRMGRRRAGVYRRGGDDRALCPDERSRDRRLCRDG